MTLVEQIEEMRIRMHEESRGEQHLVNALGLALKRADEKLLEAIRNVAAEHEARREGIMKELHALAARMGTLPASQVPAASLEDAPLKLRSYEASWPINRTGDWRVAMANVPFPRSSRRVQASREVQEAGAGGERSSRTSASET